MNQALFSAVQATNAAHLSVHSGCGPVSSASPEAHMPVGVGRHSNSFWHDLSPSEREVAIELAELRELHYEHEGQHQLAQWMRDLQAHLVAGRNQGETQ